MQFEFYVINWLLSLVVKGETNYSAEERQALQYIRNILGRSWLSSELVIQNLMGLDVLGTSATALDCKPEEVFAKLRIQLDTLSGVSRSNQLPDVSEDDCELLLSNEGQKYIAALLKCAPDDSLQTLFDETSISQSIAQVGIYSVSSTSVIDLLQLIFYSPNRKRLALHFRGRKLWEILNLWVPLQIRKEVAKELGCQPAHVLKMLVVQIKQRLRPVADGIAGTNRDQQIGMIAMGDITIRVKRLEDEWSGYAHGYAREASLCAPGIKSAALLPTLIDFYDQGSFKSALEGLLSDQSPLIQHGLKYEISNANLGFPNDAELDVSLGWLGRWGLGDVVIRCKLTPSSKPVEVLRIKGMSSEARDCLKQHLPDKVARLSPVGDSLAERILHTQVPLFISAKRRLCEAVRYLGDIFVQCFVLSNATLRPGEVIPDINETKEIYLLPHTGTCIEMPKHTAIADELIAQYKSKDINLKVVNQ